MKNKIKNQVRQGDILIERIAHTHKPAKPATENGRVILAHGEVTGHAHEIADPEQVKAVIGAPKRAVVIQGDLESQNATQAILTLGKESKLIHQEHGTIPLKRGTYRVTRQREYAPGAIRNVQD